MYHIIVSLAIFRFNENDPHDFQVGLIRDEEDGLLGLPSMEWYPQAPIEVTAKHLLATLIHVDKDWLDLEEVGNTEIQADVSYTGILSVWKTYVPDNIDVNPNIEWIDYGRLETISSRVMRHHLKALRRAKNRC